MSHGLAHGIRRSDDRGSALPLGIGLTIVCLLGAAGAIDAASVVLQRVRLESQADAAALAGAQGIDLDAYYARGASATTTLDPALASLRARRHLAAAGLPTDVHVDAVDADLTGVVVRLSAPVHLPFPVPLAERSAVRVTVESRAALAYRAGT